MKLQVISIKLSISVSCVRAMLMEFMAMALSKLNSKNCRTMAQQAYDQNNEPIQNFPNKEIQQAGQKVKPYSPKHSLTSSSNDLCP